MVILLVMIMIKLNIQIGPSNVNQQLQDWRFFSSQYKPIDTTQKLKNDGLALSHGDDVIHA